MYCCAETLPEVWVARDSHFCGLVVSFLCLCVFALLLLRPMILLGSTVDLNLMSGWMERIFLAVESLSDRCRDVVWCGWCWVCCIFAMKARVSCNELSTRAWICRVVSLLRAKAYSLVLYRSDILVCCPMVGLVVTDVYPLGSR